MKTKLGTRALLMAGLALAIVGASSLPAAAVNTNLEITTGTLTVGSDVYNLGSGGTPGACDGGGTSSLSPDIDSSGNISMATGDYALDAGTITGTNSVDYRVLIIGNAATTGTLSNSGGGSASVGINVRVEVQPCAGGTAICRTNAITGTLTDAGTGYAGSLPPAVGDTVHLEGTTATITTQFGCNTFVRPKLNGLTADLDADFVVV